jgi:hypothetical protein
MAIKKTNSKPKPKPVSYYAAALKEAALTREVAARMKSHKEFDEKALQILKSQNYGRNYYG